MSGSIAELSPAGIYELGADLRALGHKTGLGWLQLAGHLRRFGSIPSDERSVASILGVTVRFMRERAWPLLEDRLTLSDDGRRYTCPDITPWNGRQRTAARAPDRGMMKSPQQQNAANIRWGKNRQQPSEAHAEAHADAYEPHAETHVISMRGASETHAKTHSDDAPAASPDASDASSPAHAPSSLLASFSSSQATVNPSGSEEARKRARALATAESDASGDALAHAPDAPTDAPAHADRHAPTHAGSSAARRAKRSGQTIVSTRMAPDWKPTPADRLEAQRRGLDPDEFADTFRDHYLGKHGPDGLSPDWSARFRNWCRRENSPSIRQRHMTLSVQGGRPDKDSWKLDEARAAAAARAARNNADDRPIIEGMVG